MVVLTVNENVLIPVERLAQEVWHFDLVVGADGAWSRVRPAVRGTGVADRAGAGRGAAAPGRMRTRAGSWYDGTATLLWAGAGEPDPKSSLLTGGGEAGGALLTSAQDLGVDVGDVGRISEPSGRGTGYLALIDVVALWTTGLFSLSLLLSDRVQGRVQGVATLIFSILLILASLVLLVIAFVELTVMVSLFLAAPFGTLAYLALWGFFPVGEASLLLALVLLLKLVWGVLLLLAQPRFLQNKGLVLLVLTTLVCTVVLEFLHRLVPVILVSILDDVGALVFAIVAIVWGLVLLIGSIPAIVKAVRVTATVQ